MPEGFPQPSGGGPDTPWTVDHNAADFNLLGLHLLGFDMVDKVPTYINVVANLAVAPNPAGRGSDTFGILQLTFAAGFAGAAADSTLFEVQYSATKGIQGLAFINPANAAAVPAQYYSLFGSVALGFGSFKVLNHVAIGPGAAVHNIVYFSPGA